MKPKLRMRRQDVRPNHARGIVLVAVLWLVASLTLIVSGVLLTLRKEVRQTATLRDTLAASALADGAIHIALQSLKAAGAPVSRLQVMETEFSAVRMAVEIRPLNGLIDLNAAPRDLLAALLHRAGGMDKAAAVSMADVWVEVRSRRDARGVPQGIESTEDLLGLPGVDYALYARLKNLVTADLRGSGRVNPLAAPLEVLWVLTDGDLARAEQIVTARAATALLPDLTGMPPAFVDPQASSLRMQLTVRVPMEGGFWTHSRWVDLSGNSREGLPWRTFRTDAWLEPRPAGVDRVVRKMGQSGAQA